MYTSRLRRDSWILGLALVVSGCASASGGAGAVPETLRFTIERTDAGAAGEDASLFHFRGRLEGRDRVFQSPVLTFVPSRWAVITVGEGQTRMAPIPWSEEMEEAGLMAVRLIDSGLYLAVRCAEGEAGGIDTKIRAYYFAGGEVVWSREVEAALAAGQEQKI